MIFDYRMRNNIPVGDIEDDIDRYYCTRWPSACNKEPKDYLPQGAPGERREPLSSRVARWAGWLAQRMPRGGFALVTQEEADRRSAICGQCPKNVAWKVGCSGCNSSTTTLLMQLRSLRISAKAGNLMGCEVGGWDNMTAVHLDRSLLELTEKQTENLPKDCWRK